MVLGMILVVGLCQGPIDVSIKASLTGRNGILNNIKKGKLRSPNLIMLPVSIIRDRLEYEWCYQPHLDTTLSRI